MKTKFAFVALACLALCVSACNSSPQDRLVGKWEAGMNGVKLAVEFAKDGKAKITTPFGQTLQGTYKVNGGDELEWTMGGMTTKAKMKLTGSELQLTNDGKTITYKKV